MDSCSKVLERTLLLLHLDQEELDVEFDTLVAQVVEMASILRLSSKSISVIPDEKELIVVHDLFDQTFNQTYVKATPDSNNGLRHLLFVMHKSIRCAA
jgi:hypothetical protein